MLPQDPVILLSVVNTRLRDGCGCLEELCSQEDVCLEDLCAKLAAMGYTYDPESNQFK